MYVCAPVVFYYFTMLSKTNINVYPLCTSNIIIPIRHIKDADWALNYSYYYYRQFLRMKKKQ